MMKSIGDGEADGEKVIGRIPFKTLVKKQDRGAQYQRAYEYTDNSGEMPPVPVMVEKIKHRLNEYNNILHCKYF